MSDMMSHDGKGIYLFVFFVFTGSHAAVPWELVCAHIPRSCCDSGFAPSI